MGTEVRATFCLLHYDRGMIRDALWGKQNNSA